MSHAQGAIRFKDGMIKFYEYNGTADIAQPTLYDTREDLMENFRNGNRDQWRVHECERSEPVEIFSTYGGGFYWSGRACRHCKIITAGCDPFNQAASFNPKASLDVTDRKNGFPKWYQDAFLGEKV